MKKSIWETLAERQFDVSDTPQEPVPPKRKGPPSAVPVKRNPALAAKGHAYNPGLPPERRKDEAVPTARDSAANVAYSRSRSKTMPMIPAMPAKVAEPPVPAGAGKTWEVETTKGEVFRVEANSAQEAQQLMMDFMADERSKQGIKGQLHPGEFKVRPAPVAGEAVQETTTGANGAGFQMPMGDAAEAAERVYFKEALHEVFKETVRKLPNGKYGVYLKNRGKKKAPKKVGEYPDRIAAREAELSRGGKTGDAAKKEREKLNNLKKDPKKMAAAKKRDAKTKPKKAAKESIINALAQGINEALFREDDVPGSPWDERLANLSSNALGSDKKLTKLTQAISKASASSLMDAGKMLIKALRKQARCNMGEIGTETGGKMYLPMMLDVDGDEHGPLYLYVDRGQVKLEMADELDESLDGLEDGMGHNILGAIMAFRQKELPKIAAVKQAVDARDKYLDSLDGKMDGHLAGLSGVELQIIKNLINTKHGRRFR